MSHRQAAMQSLCMCAQQQGLLLQVFRSSCKTKQQLLATRKSSPWPPTCPDQQSQLACTKRRVQDVLLHLLPAHACVSCRPAGKLKVTVKATWLKDAKVDVDALTELSFGTHRSTEGGLGPEEEYEQVDTVLVRLRAMLSC